MSRGHRLPTSPVLESLCMAHNEPLAFSGPRHSDGLYGVVEGRGAPALLAEGACSWAVLCSLACGALLRGGVSTLIREV